MRTIFVLAALAAPLTVGCSVLLDTDHLVGDPTDAGPTDAPSDAPSRDTGLDAPTDAGCTGATEMMCGTECVDTSTSAAHCGDCDNPCAAPNECRGGACIDPVIDVEAAGAHACALRASGQVWCWGSNVSGQIGDGTTIERHAATRVVGVDDAVQISLGALDAFGRGYGSTCARHRTGEVSCWGYVARPDHALTSSPMPTRIAGITDAIDVSVGDSHACLARAGGLAECWGRNAAGQLGNGSTAEWVPAPSAVLGLTDAVGVSAGLEQSCAVRADGTVMCWGEGSNGEIGDRPRDTTMAVSVTGPVNIAVVRTGAGCSCALTVAGAIQCWGTNTASCLGADVDRTFMPWRVESARDFLWLSENDGGRACGLRATGDVVCWGLGLGDPTPIDGGSPQFRMPVEVETWRDARDVAPALRFFCGIDSSGTVLCYGGNAWGQLGDGTTEMRDAPVEVTGLF